MKKRIVQFTWDDEDAQKAFAELCPFPDSATTHEDVDNIEKLAGICPPMRILDVGCGNGRHSSELAKRGYSVVGIDVAKRFLAEAQVSQKQTGLNVEFRFQRASELNEPERFDFVLAYWHTIGFMSLEEINLHFKSIYSVLKPGGTFLYTFQGPKLMSNESNIPTRNWKEQDGKFILTEKKIENGFRDENCIVIDTNNEEMIEYREHQRAFSLDDICRYLTGAGFEQVDAYSGFDRAPAGPDNFSVFVCRRAIG